MILEPLAKPSRGIDATLFAFLTLDGLLVGVLSVFLTYVRIDDTAVPIGIAVALVGNAILAWLALGTTDAPWRWAPLLAWMAVVLIAGLSGPGGDVLLVTDWRAIGLLIGGVVGPVVVARMR